MRRKVIAGNWKMNGDLIQSKDLITKLISGLNGQQVHCEVIICPPFISLSEASSLVKNTTIKLGAQNMYFEDSGAFTGEISPAMLKGAGCEFVILGHSERRIIFGETDELINKKIKKALQSDLKPIFCVGETLEERESGITKKVVERQVVNGLNGIPESDLKNIILAYEPVWAIGTGVTATSAQAEEIHEFIRNIIAEKYSKKTAENLVIQYGGSVKADNAAELLSQKNIDGALVGGACLKSDSFIAIIKSV